MSLDELNFILLLADVLDVLHTHEGHLGSTKLTLSCLHLFLLLDLTLQLFVLLLGLLVPGCDLLELDLDCLLFIFEVAFVSALEFLLKQVFFVGVLNFDVANLFS